ncbi:MAG: efflux RND transporter periplasmic adaptor subunit [Bacillota bacterium]
MIQRLMMICFILAVVLGGGYYAYQQLVPPPEETAEGPVYSTHKVARGDISVGVEASGSLNPSRGGGLEVPHGRTPGGMSSYVVDKVLVEEGQPVVQGQVVVLLYAPELGPRIKNIEDQLRSHRESLAKLLDIPVEQVSSIDPSRGITLRSPIDGRVVGLTAKEGVELKQGQIVARVVDDSHFRLTAKLVPSEFNEARGGGMVVLRFPQFDGVVPAMIKDINPNPVPEDSRELDLSRGGLGQEEGTEFVHWTVIEGKNPGLIRSGMIAQIGLVPPGQAADGFYAKWLRYPARVEGYVNEEVVLNRVDAIPSRIHVREMSPVKMGDPLVTLAGKDAQKTIEEKLAKIRELEFDLLQLRSQMGMLEVKAPMDGVIAHLEKQPGQTVHPGEWFGSVYNTSDMQMWVQVDDVDILLVQQGSPVEVTLDALPGRVLEGTVEFIEAMGKERGGIARFGVHIKVKGIPELRPGMQAKARINASTARDVLLVPLEAIFDDGGQPKVEILQPDGRPKVVAVQLGLMDHRWAEVKSGLEEGDLVITGSTADLLPSQRIQSKNNLLPGSPGESPGQSRSGGGSTSSGTK